MDYQQILSTIRALPFDQQSKLVVELTGKPQTHDYLSFRREQLLNKQVGCPQCKSHKYYPFGKDMGSLRFNCKECQRTFTEHTGTWMAGIHKKELINDYLELMSQEKSLDKIKTALAINKKTAFNWRHKILSSLEEVQNGNFNGIVESDESFFRHSDKGKKSLERIGRKQAGSSSTRGISSDQVAVIVTADRKGAMGLSVATLGRISKADIEHAIGIRIEKDAILCTDGHVNYNGFAKDNQLSLVVMRSNLKQHVKIGIYHIQNVNSLHNRMKKWIDLTFWRVSTKYLQNYLNWYRIQQTFKNSLCPAADLVKCSTVDLFALDRYKTIDKRYQALIATQ